MIDIPVRLHDPRLELINLRLHFGNLRNIPVHRNNPVVKELDLPPFDRQAEFPDIQIKRPGLQNQCFFPVSLRHTNRLLKQVMVVRADYDVDTGDRGGDRLIMKESHVGETYHEIHILALQRLHHRRGYSGGDRIENLNRRRIRCGIVPDSQAEYTDPHAAVDDDVRLHKLPEGGGFLRVVSGHVQVRGKERE